MWKKYSFKYNKTHPLSPQHYEPSQQQYTFFITKIEIKQLGFGWNKGWEKPVQHLHAIKMLGYLKIRKFLWVYIRNIERNPKLLFC